MLTVLSSILCDLDPKVKVIGQKAGICDGLPSTSALVSFTHAPLICLIYSYRFTNCLNFASCLARTLVDVHCFAWETCNSKLFYIRVFTGWEQKIHVTPSVDLYSGQIIVKTCRVSFRLFIYVI